MQCNACILCRYVICLFMRYGECMWHHERRLQHGFKQCWAIKQAKVKNSKYNRCQVVSLIRLQQSLGVNFLVKGCFRVFSSSGGNFYPLG